MTELAKYSAGFSLARALYYSKMLAKFYAQYGGPIPFYRDHMNYTDAKEYTRGFLAGLRSV